MSKEHGALLILYEQSHANLATSGTRVACLNFWLERELASRGVACLSLGDHLPAETTSAGLVAGVRMAAREWYRLPQMNFFTHKSILVGEALEPMLEAYLLRYTYWRYALARVLDAAPGTSELVVPESSVGVSATAGPLALFEVCVVIDAARSLAMERGLAFRTLGDASRLPTHRLYPRARLQEVAVAFYNFLIGFVPRRPLRIFASEYWRNIAPFVENMDDVELVLMERSEFHNIPWLQLWKHRVRFVNPRAIALGAVRTEARATIGRFRTAWFAAQKTLEEWEGWNHVGVPWAVIGPALTYLVEIYAERVVVDIEGLENILAHEKPSNVLMRASIGERQPHFFLAARVARRLGIPSIEQQHAGAYIDPRSALSRLETDYLASYGPYENGWYERNGYASERLVSIGSPRFDRYIFERDEARARGKQLLQEAGLNPARPVLLATVPEEGVGAGTNSYGLADFFRAVAGVQVRMPELQIVFKFRPGHIARAPRAFALSIIPGAVCMAKEDLYSLICASSVVVCGNSTVIYETLIGRKPLLLYPWRVDDLYHAQMYAPAAPIAYSSTELEDLVARVFADDAYRESLITRGQDFLGGYSFDGRSDERMAALLRDDKNRSDIVAI